MWEGRNVGRKIAKFLSQIALPWLTFSKRLWVFFKVCVHQIEILLTSRQLPFSHNPAQKKADEFPSVLAATKGKVTDGNNIGRPITRFLKYVPELLDEVVDTKMYS